MTFKRIPPSEANELVAKGECNLLDVRDEQSFNAGHITGARHLDNTSVQDFLQEADPDLPLLIYCYHGNSSQSAAQFFVEKDFTEVYSVDGGFELWRQQPPSQ